jgi:glycine/betaine/sarcosine/D-proline reductase family selenoprotein B
LEKPLQQCRIGLVTTAAPYQEKLGDQGPGADYNAAAKFYSVYALPSEGNPDVRISHVGYDRTHTDATDSNTWFPLTELKYAERCGDIGALSPRFYGLPTNRSQATTMDRDCVQLLGLVNEDNLDAVILVPNCPVCHQSCSLAARQLEQNGITTVIMGCAKDIVEHVGVPRLLFSDFPLGNGAGKPGDKDSQRQTLGLGLQLLANAVAPRTTVQSPIVWSPNHEWKQDFYNIEKLSSEAVQALRQEFDNQKSVAKEKKKRDGL